MADTQDKPGIHVATPTTPEDQARLKEIFAETASAISETLKKTSAVEYLSGLQVRSSSPLGPDLERKLNEIFKTTESKIKSRISEKLEVNYPQKPPKPPGSI